MANRHNIFKKEQNHRRKMPEFGLEEVRKQNENNEK